jgi:hypothetical protein
MCARRFHLRTSARLFPPGASARPSLSEEAVGEPAAQKLRRGSLAGQLLRQLAPGHDGAELEGLLMLAGIDPDEAPARELRAHLTRFITAARRRGSLLGGLLRGDEDGARVERGVSYAVAVAGGALTLSGLLDAVHLRQEGGGWTVTVLDYHYSLAPGDAEQGEGPLHAQRRLLLSRVAAALYPQATTLRTGLCFLREADAEPTLQTTDRAALVALDAALRAAAPATALTLQSALRLPVLPSATCTALSCEYQPLCHRRPPAAPAV